MMDVVFEKRIEDALKKQFNQFVIEKCNDYLAIGYSKQNRGMTAR